MLYSSVSGGNTHLSMGFFILLQNFDWMFRHELVPEVAISQFSFQ